MARFIFFFALIVCLQSAPVSAGQYVDTNFKANLACWGGASASFTWSNEFRIDDNPCPAIGLHSSQDKINASGFGAIVMDWSGWVSALGNSGYYGPHGRTIKVAGALQLGSTFAPSGDLELTFLWIQKSTSAGTGKVTFNKKGNWFYGELDKLQIGDGLITQASIDTPGVFEINVEYDIGCDRCDTGVQKGDAKIEYRVISPNFCTPEESAWDGKDLGTSASDALTRMVCISKNVPKIQIDHRGSQLYSKIEALNQIANNSPAHPHFSRLAGIQLDRIWKIISENWESSLRSESKFRKKIAQLLISDSEETSIVQLLNQSHNAFDDIEHRKKKINEIFEMKKQIDDISKATSAKHNTDEIDYFRLLRMFTSAPQLMTIDELNEAILGTLIIGADILDEANLSEQEATIYAASNGD